MEHCGKHACIAVNHVKMDLSEMIMEFCLKISMSSSGQGNLKGQQVGAFSKLT